MVPNQLREWFVANQLGLLIGASVGAAIIAALLVLRWLGRRALEKDPDRRHWRGVIGQALAKTTMAFMIVAAADSFSTYANLPPRLARVIDIAFIVAFALQGAIWARELFLGMIARRVVDAEGGSTLVNAMSLIRVMVSFTVFAIALILMLDNL